jgi:hypothetical protein
MPPDEFLGNRWVVKGDVTMYRTSKVKEYVRARMAGENPAPIHRASSRVSLQSLIVFSDPPLDECGKVMRFKSNLEKKWEYILVREGLALDRGRRGLTYGCDDNFLDFVTTPEAKKREREFYLLKKFLTPRKKAA